MSEPLRMLLVDDDAALRRTLGRLFSRRGWQVTEAGDGVEGLEALRAGGFDLLLTDMRMPRMDGLELLELARAELGSTVPAIVLSGYHGHPEARLRELGVAEILGKPTEPMALIETCTRVARGE